MRSAGRWWVSPPQRERNRRNWLNLHWPARAASRSGVGLALFAHVWILREKGVQLTAVLDRGRSRAVSSSEVPDNPAREV
jgi:hypothetical protein